jgi:hypothetical protein
MKKLMFLLILLCVFNKVYTQDEVKASYDNVFFQMSENLIYEEVDFNPDGTRMYLLNSNREVEQYDLTIATDVRTSSLSYTVEESFDAFRWSGFEMGYGGDFFVVGDDDADQFLFYPLSTAYDLSSEQAPTAHGNMDASGGVFPTMIVLSADSNYLVTNRSASHRELWQHTFSTKGDLSSLSTGVPAKITVSTEGLYPIKGMVYGQGGYSIIINTDFNIEEWQLASPYDITTIQGRVGLTPVPQGNNKIGVAKIENYSKLYLVDDNQNRVYSYTYEFSCINYGLACDDGDSNTNYDTYDINCECIGIQAVYVLIYRDTNSGEYYIVNNGRNFKLTSREDVIAMTEPKNRILELRDSAFNLQMQAVQAETDSLMKCPDGFVAVKTSGGSYECVDAKPNFADSVGAYVKVDTSEMTVNSEGEIALKPVEAAGQVPIPLYIKIGASNPWAVDITLNGQELGPPTEANPDITVSGTTITASTTSDTYFNTNLTLGFGDVLEWTYVTETNGLEVGVHKLTDRFAGNANKEINTFLSGTSMFAVYNDGNGFTNTGLTHTSTDVYQLRVNQSSLQLEIYQNGGLVYTIPETVQTEAGTIETPYRTSVASDINAVQSDLDQFKTDIGDSVSTNIIVGEGLQKNGDTVVVAPVEETQFTPLLADFYHENTGGNAGEIFDISTNLGAVLSLDGLTNATYDGSNLQMTTNGSDAYLGDTLRGDLVFVEAKSIGTVTSGGVSFLYIGLSENAAPAAQPKYSWSFNRSTTTGAFLCQVRVDGAFIGSFGTFTNSTVLRVERRSNGDVVYLKDGVVQHTAAAEYTPTVVGTTPLKDVVESNQTVATDLNSVSGWSYVKDGQYTTSSRLTVNLGDTTQITIDRGGANITAHLPIGVDSLWDANLNKIIPDGIGDAYEMRIDFIAEPQANDLDFDLLIDIGDGTTPNWIVDKNYGFNKGSGIEQGISFTVPIFTLNTFKANGGKLLIKPSGTIELWDFALFIQRTHKAK